MLTVRYVQKRGTRRARGGMALPTVLIVLVVLTLLGTAALFTGSTALDITRNGREELQGLSIAEAGVHEAFARLNIKDETHANRITPAEVSVGVPNGTWSARIVNSGSLGSGDVQTLSGPFGGSSTLPVWTEVRYKKEATELPLAHCDDDNADSTPDCDTNEVVRYHTNYQYGGSRAPYGNQVGPAVIQIESRFTRNGAITKTVLVEAVRSVTTARTPGTVRTCGNITCQGSTVTDGTSHPDGVAIVAGGTQSGCDDAHVEPNPSTNPNTVQAGASAVACPVPPSRLFEDTFGMTKEEMKSMADIVTPGPYEEPLSGTRGKIIYVTGDTAFNTWNSNPVIGTADEPVIVIFEGDFRVEGGITVNGFIYVMGDFQMGNGNWTLNGAIAVEGSLTSDVSGNSTLRYDPSVMNNLNRLTPFTAILWKVN